MTNKKFRHKMRRVLLRAKLPYHIAVCAANKSVNYTIDYAVEIALKKYGYDCMWDCSEVFDSVLIAFKRYKYTNFAERFRITVKHYDNESITINNKIIQIPNGDYDGFIRKERIFYNEI